MIFKMAEGGEALDEVFKPDKTNEPNKDHDVTLLSMVGDDMSQTRPSIGEELRQVTETPIYRKINKFYNYIGSVTRIDASLPNSEIGLQDLTNSALQVNTELKTLQTKEDTNIDQVMETINDPPLLPLRELQGLDKALQSVRGETMMNLAKLSELDKYIEKQENKLAEADDANLSMEVKQMIQKRLTDLYTELSAKLEALSINREKLITNFARIKETVHNILHEDTTLAERIQTLFREQGVTIFSTLTAVGMTISTLVLALTRTVGIGGSAGGSVDLVVVRLKTGLRRHYKT